MNIEAFNNLELIPALVSELQKISDRMEKLLPPITTKKEVAKFLGVSERTINNYISLGYLKDGKHFYRKNGKILVFIEIAIIEFRDNLNKGMVK